MLVGWLSLTLGAALLALAAGRLHHVDAADEPAVLLIVCGVLCGWLAGALSVTWAASAAPAHTRLRDGGDGGDGGDGSGPAASPHRAVAAGLSLPGGPHGPARAKAPLPLLKTLGVRTRRLLLLAALLLLVAAAALLAAGADALDGPGGEVTDPAALALLVWGALLLWASVTAAGVLAFHQVLTRTLTLTPTPTPTPTITSTVTQAPGECSALTQWVQAGSLRLVKRGAIKGLALHGRAHLDAASAANDDHDAGANPAAGAAARGSTRDGGGGGSSGGRNSGGGSSGALAEVDLAEEEQQAAQQQQAEQRRADLAAEQVGL